MKPSLLLASVLVAALALCGLGWVVGGARQYGTKEGEARKDGHLLGARLIGKAALAYSRHNGGFLPNPSNFRARIGRYLDRRGLSGGSLKRVDESLGAFFWAFGGGQAPVPERLGTTILGYVPDPQGLAMVYLDGHVEWKDR